MPTIITQSTVWTAGSKITLTDDIQIDFGATLTIEPGVTIKGNDHRITAWGTLLIDGNADDKVKLEKLNIAFGRSSGTPASLIEIHFADIKDSSLVADGAKYKAGVFILADSNVSQLRDAIDLALPASSSRIERNIFTHSAGINVGVIDSTILIKDNVFYEQTTPYAIRNWINTNDGLFVEGNSFLSTDKIALTLDPSSTLAKLSAQDNYFGTVDAASISNMILDRNDSLEYPGKIDVSGSLTKPSPNAPVYTSDDDNVTYAPSNTAKIDGQLGFDTLKLSGSRDRYELKNLGNGSYSVTDKTVDDGSHEIRHFERLKFTDFSMNLNIATTASSVVATDLKLLIELYCAFFNRVPDADGLEYWIKALKGGATVSSISDSFYTAAIDFSAQTGYNAQMTDDDFVRVIYKNVLGRSDTTAPSADDTAYWSDGLADGHESKGSLVKTMLSAAHSYKGDATWGWVADLLDNKAEVGHFVAVTNGIAYDDSAQAITKGMAIAAAITPTDTQAAIKLTGVPELDFSLT